jgi:hypothetical protein
MLEAAAALDRVLYWPPDSDGGDMFAITDPSMLPHLPDEMREFDPPPVVVKTVDDFIAAVPLIWVG